MILAFEDQNYDPEAAMWQFADSPGKHMFLVVKQSKFEVVYGMQRCTLVHHLGERIAWLMGDRCVIAGLTVPPGLLIKALGWNTQSDLFTNVDVHAPSLKDLCSATQAQSGESLYDQDANQTVTSWPVLPIQATLACLFMKGVPLREGFALGCQILDLILDRFDDKRRVWTDFLRAAVTWREAEVEVSALAMAWICKDQFANAALTDWYFTLIAQAAAPVPDPYRLVPPRLGGADMALAAATVPVPPRPVLTMPGGAVTAPVAVQFPVLPFPAATMPGGAVIPLSERNDGVPSWTPHSAAKTHGPRFPLYQRGSHLPSELIISMDDSVNRAPIDYLNCDDVGSSGGGKVESSFIAEVKWPNKLWSLLSSVF
jgi:hypothetical protein